MICAVDRVPYGPVLSGRLGRSLGVDMISRIDKTCSFDCAHCQLGPTRHHTAERSEFVPLAQLAEELRRVSETDLDYVAFSGTGEPTLAANLGEAISLVKDRFAVPATVLTNASLMSDPQVRRDLAEADEVVAALAAPTQRLLEDINRPVPEITLVKLLTGLHLFRSEYRGRLALQIMFCRANSHWATALAALARGIGPDEVQINTPLRPCPVRPLPPDEIAEITSIFSDLPVRPVYDSPGTIVQPFSMSETLARRAVL
jgi:wyosine [tRNA(Phe)-imidazoG37] synthetase (radical SAM superfamily)